MIELLGQAFEDETDFFESTYQLDNLDEQWENIQDNMDKGDFKNIVHLIGIEGKTLLEALEELEIIADYEGDYYILVEHYTEI